DSPQRVITLQDTKADREVKLFVGEASPGTESSVVYVSSSDDPKKVYAVRKNALSAALEPLTYFRSRDLLGDSTTDVRSIKLTEGKKPAVRLEKVKDRWRAVEPPYGYTDVVSNDLLGALTRLRVPYKDEKDNGFVAEGVTDLAKYHLDPSKGEVLRIEVGR